MNILHVVSGMDVNAGGVTQAIRTIVLGLTEAGYVNEIACFDSPYLDVHHGLIIHFQGKAKTPWQYGARMKPWLKENIKRFDIVIVHGLWVYHSFILYQVWQRMGGGYPDLYVMPHGMLDPYFQRAKDRKLKAIRNWIYWKYIEKHLINKAAGLLFTCEMEKQLARETFRLYHPQKELVVGLGVESPPVFSQKMTEAFFEKWKTTDRKPYWLYLSRIHPKKGIDVLINAYIDLKQIYHDIPALVIAGPGIETEFGQKMKALAHSAEDIQFVGMLTGDAKWGAFYGCEAFVLPSHQENFGIAVVEAMACEKPVLISDQVNIWQEVACEGGGIIAPATEVGVKEQLIKWLSLSTMEKATMGEKAQTAFRKYFSVKEATKRMISAIALS